MANWTAKTIVLHVPHIIFAILKLFLYFLCPYEWFLIWIRCRFSISSSKCKIAWKKDLSFHRKDHACQTGVHKGNISYINLPFSLPFISNKCHLDFKRHKMPAMLSYATYYIVYWILEHIMPFQLWYTRILTITIWNKFQTFNRLVTSRYMPIVLWPK